MHPTWSTPGAATAGPRNEDPFSPPLNFLSAPTSTLPCEASVLTRPRSAVTWVCDGRHAGKCHGQRAVPLLPSGLSGVARGRSAPPPRCPLPRSPTPPLPRRIGRGCSCSGTSDSLFRVSLSFHGLLKAVRLAAQPWDPPSCRNLPGTPVVMPSVSLGTPGLPVPRPSPACHRAFPFTEHLRGPFDPMPRPRAEQHRHHLILQLRKLRHRGKAS